MSFNIVFVINCIWLATLVLWNRLFSFVTFQRYFRASFCWKILLLRMLRRNEVILVLFGKADRANSWSNTICHWLLLRIHSFKLILFNLTLTWQIELVLSAFAFSLIIRLVVHSLFFLFYNRPLLKVRNGQSIICSCHHRTLLYRLDWVCGLNLIIISCLFGTIVIWHNRFVFKDYSLKIGVF